MSDSFSFSLDANMPADKAVMMIYLQLLQTIKDNEQGTINAIDVEFLHNFRVAVRKTRSALSQLKTLLPSKMRSRYSQYFSWLGKITSINRDLDVYLLNFDHYKNAISVDLREDLNPLQEFLKIKQSIAQDKLGKQLSSPEYLSTLNEWQYYLQQSLSENNSYCLLTAKQLADSSIYKAYQKSFKQGLAIGVDSLPSDLHDLRKTCKKLRYLIEFFQNLYPPSKIKKITQAVKELQECLGAFQDLAVQEETLKHFAKEMNLTQNSDRSFLAINALVQVFETKRCQARNDFEGCFATFIRPRNQKLFRKLFASKQ